MSFRFPHLRRPRCFILAVTALAFAIPQPASANAQKVKKTAAKKDEKKDPFAVPDGKPKEILTFLLSMKSRSPGSFAEFKKIQGAILKAADKILSAKPDEATEVKAIRAKFDALTVLVRVRDRTASAKLQKFAESLKNDKRKDIAELAKTQLLMHKLTARSRRVFALKPKEREKLVEDVLAFLKGGDLRGRLRIATNMARGLERAGSRDLAAKTYTQIAAILTKSKSATMVKYAAKMEGSARRIMLLGNTMDIKGTTVDGKPFKWRDYKGKVVLVDFWATWCRPCILELPNVKRMYELYHDKGFEIVGISLDRSTQKDRLVKFIKDRDIKWTNLFSTDPKATAWDHPMATYYGIMSIPNVLLVDQKGKVVSLRARGPELGRQLAKLLGPPGKSTDTDNGQPQDQLIGEWLKVDKKTGSTKRRVAITREKNTWLIKTWGYGGVGGTTEIPHKQRKLHLLGSSVGDKSLEYGFASYDAGFKEVHNVVHLEKDELIVETFNIFKDGSGRSNYRVREVLKRKK